MLTEPLIKQLASIASVRYGRSLESNTPSRIPPTALSRIA